MSGFEWFLVIVVVILIPLAIAVVVTLWTLEQARKRNPRNRPGGKASGTKRLATRSAASSGSSEEPGEPQAGIDHEVRKRA